MLNLLKRSLSDHLLEELGTQGLGRKKSYSSRVKDKKELLDPTARSNRSTAKINTPRTKQYCLRTKQYLNVGNNFAGLIVARFEGGF